MNAIFDGLGRDKEYLRAIYRWRIDFPGSGEEVGERNVCIRILMNNRLKSVDASRE